jgi:antitoxin HicB
MPRSPKPKRRTTGSRGLSERRRPVGPRRKRKQGVRSPRANPRSGSTLDDVLHEEGLYEDATSVAIKRVLAWQIAQAMKAQGVSKVGLARRMGTSRSALDRLLDPENDSVTLRTLSRVAAVLGAALQVTLGVSAD